VDQQGSGPRNVTLSQLVVAAEPAEPAERKVLDTHKLELEAV
jgi:hypothetical protein